MNMEILCTRKRLIPNAYGQMGMQERMLSAHTSLGLGTIQVAAAQCNSVYIATF